MIALTFARRCFALSPLLLIGCHGIAAGSTYPGYDSGKVQEQLLTPENQEDPSISLGAFKFKDEVCKGVDTHPISTALTQDSLTRFLDAQGIRGVDVKARDNLFWFEFPGDKPEEGERVRLRLAVLDDPNQAADELHKSLLQHGPGWWGLRRSNLSVLAPKGGLSESVAFALRYKLVCWGMMSVSDLDDVYVIPGPYTEL
jgi:hypothetical protein